jgi:hypothetical protein
VPTIGIFLIDFLVRTVLLYHKDRGSEAQHAMPLGSAEHIKMAPAPVERRAHGIGALRHLAVRVSVADFSLMELGTPWNLRGAVR